MAYRTSEPRSRAHTIASSSSAIIRGLPKFVVVPPSSALRTLATAASASVIMELWRLVYVDVGSAGCQRLSHATGTKGSTGSTSHCSRLLRPVTWISGKCIRPPEKGSTGGHVSVAKGSTSDRTSAEGWKEVPRRSKQYGTGACSCWVSVLCRTSVADVVDVVSWRKWPGLLAPALDGLISLDSSCHRDTYCVFTFRCV